MTFPPAEKPGDGRVLAVDLGSRRIGLAVSDETRTAVTELGSVPSVGPKRDAAAIRAVLASRLGVDWGRTVSLLVVGLPLLPGGDEGEAAAAARHRAADLARRLELPHELVDERGTSVAARRSLREEGLSRRRRARESGRVDARAASLILGAWLAETASTAADGEAP